MNTINRDNSISLNLNIFPDQFRKIPQKDKIILNNKRKQPCEDSSVIQKATLPILQSNTNLQLQFHAIEAERGIPVLLSQSKYLIGDVEKDFPASDEINREFSQLLVEERIECPSLPSKEIYSFASKPILYISNPKVASILDASQTVIKAAFSDFPFIHPAYAEGVMWGRDSRIFLPSRQYLIPAEIPYNDEELGMKLKNFIAEDEFIGDDYYGYGFSPAYRFAAISHAKENGIPIRPDTKSCIEGGNCQIFKTDDGIIKAIIGVHSLWLTYISLETRGWYEDKEYLSFRTSYLKDKKHPDQDSIRIANNFINTGTELFPGIKMIISRANSKKIISLMALEVEARREAAKKLISNELGISVENIAYLQQREFHIDFDCFPGLNNVVFLHSENKVLEFLNSARDKINKNFSLDSFIKGVKISLKKSKERMNKNLLALRNIGCNPIPIAGDFINHDETRINFMNGVRISSLYLTNGTEDSPLKNLFKSVFKETVEKHCPGLQIVYICDKSLTMEELLGKQKGGFRCMTWMNKDP